MNKYPLFSSEVNIDNINYSNINYNDNKQFIYMNYGDSNETLYIQSPILKFIEPIIKQKNNHKILYLFLTPHDSTTYSFIKLINNIENKSLKYVNHITDNNLDINKTIKNYDLDTEDSKQIIMYFKTTLLDQTKIEYQNEFITFEDLNELVNKVNLKLIFEISMLWLSNTKLGLYLKPLKIKAIDIVESPIIDFRDENSPSPHDLLHTEVDHIERILNSSTVINLNDSAFNTKKFKNIESENYNLKNFIKDNSTDLIENKLKNELFNLKKSSSRNSIKSTKQTKQTSESISSESSSVRITEFARKKNVKRRGRPRKQKEDSDNTSDIDINLNNINLR